jgi:hypothetical protein
MTDSQLPANVALIAEAKRIISLNQDEYMATYDTFITYRDGRDGQVYALPLCDIPSFIEGMSISLML